MTLTGLPLDSPLYRRVIGVRRPLPRFCTVVFLGAVALHCTSAPSEVPSPPFDEVFELIDVIELEEIAGDSIGEIGNLVELATGFAIADKVLPRVRSYAEDGSLLAGFGRFGTGPWEFRGIDWVGALPFGRIGVVGTYKQGITILSQDLTPDTLLAIPYAVTKVFSLGDDIVFHGLGPLGGDAMTDEELERMPGFVHRFSGAGVAWSRWRGPVFDKPYHESFVRLAQAVAGDSIFIMTSLAYPATILNGVGDSVGTIGVPSRRFRPIPEVPPGYFATEQSGPRVARFLASFDDVSRLDPIHDDYLVFTIGRFDDTRPWHPFFQLHTRVELYDRHSGNKLYEDVPLPEGSKVIGGGSGLYVLLNPDFPPWRIAKYRLAPRA